MYDIAHKFHLKKFITLLYHSELASQQRLDLWSSMLSRVTPTVMSFCKMGGGTCPYCEKNKLEGQNQSSG